MARRNQRPTKFPSLQSAGAALFVNLLNMKERQKRNRNIFGVVLRTVPFVIFQNTKTDRFQPASSGR
jgi:hypothetical protein